MAETATTEQPTGFSRNELMTLGELAEVFRFKTARSAERAALANGIRVFQFGRYKRVPRKDVEKLLEDRD